PRNMIDPETIFPGGSGISLMIERFATDLPEPDSPTMPSVSPGLTLKLMPSTAFTVPSSVSKYVRRSLTLRRLPLVLMLLTASSFADRARRAIHHPENSARKASKPSSRPERSTARDRWPGYLRLPRPDCPTKLAAA